MNPKGPGGWVLRAFVEIGDCAARLLNPGRAKWNFTSTPLLYRVYRRGRGGKGCFPGNGLWLEYRSLPSHEPLPAALCLVSVPLCIYLPASFRTGRPSGTSSSSSSSSCSSGWVAAAVARHNLIPTANTFAPPTHPTAAPHAAQPIRVEHWRGVASGASIRRIAHVSASAGIHYSAI